MRWLFFILLFLNVAFIAWQMSRPPGDIYASTAKDSGREHAILLLSEVGKQHADAGGDSGAASAGDAEQARSENEEVGKNLASLQPSGETGSAKLKAESDVDGQQVTAISDKAVPVQSTAGHCYTLGPFRDLDVLRRLTNEVKPYVLAVDFRGKEAKDEPLYWVFIRPFKDRQTALAAGSRLKAGNVRDYFVIRDGENADGISLGYFRVKKSADGIQKRVEKLGFDVVVEPIFKTYTVYWLDYQLRDDMKIPGRILEKYVGSSKDHRIKRLNRECAP